MLYSKNLIHHRVNCSTQYNNYYLFATFYHYCGIRVVIEDNTICYTVIVLLFLQYIVLQYIVLLLMI